MRPGPVLESVRRFLATALLRAACVCAACGAPGTPSDEPVRTDRVTIVDTGNLLEPWAFSSQTVAVPRGTVVTWRNAGREFHSVTADGPELPFDLSVDAGMEATFRFDAAGAFPYHCGVHPEMTGRVIVCDGACP